GRLVANYRTRPKATDYKVGRGRPPVETRWKRGQSGNPSGRPKGSKNLQTILNEALDEKVTVKERGQEKKITVREVIARALLGRAAKGDMRAIMTTIQLDGEISQSPPTSYEMPPNISAQKASDIYCSIMRSVAPRR
ncbi:MAG: hypothetical protein J0I29_02260, partial [Rhizobiales bacterium]|nr:hypothetical protein [Hyphomicrobiales bacterium]